MNGVFDLQKRLLQQGRNPFSVLRVFETTDQVTER